MNNGARLFAYTTWVLMISLAIIVFTDTFLVYANDDGWIGLVTLLGYGFIYLNFSYLSVKRFIRKVFQESNLHYILAFLIFLPPAVWIALFSETIEDARYIMILILAFSSGLGAYYGYRAGKREQAAYMEQVNQSES
jgi:hypothetical protein